MTELSLVRHLENTLSSHWQADVKVGDMRRLTGGAASQTTAFVAQRGDFKDALILRCGDDEQQFENALTKPVEAQLITLLHRQGLPVPEVLTPISATEHSGAGFIMRRLVGESLPKNILRDERYAGARERLAGQCGAVLAALHNVDPGAATMLPKVGVEENLARYQQRYREFAQALPVFDLAFKYLDDHPPPERANAIVHGDFRNGNLLIDEAGLVGVLDWELAHIGNPIEDLGWLCVNSWRFSCVDKAVGGFGDKSQLLRAYNQGRNSHVDLAELNYWEMFGVLKWGVLCLYQSAVHLRGAQRSVERAVIGRRISECEADLIRLLKGAQ